MTWYAHMPAWAHSGAYSKYVEITSEIYLMKPLGGEVNLRWWTLNKTRTRNSNILDIRILIFFSMFLEKSDFLKISVNNIKLLIPFQAHAVSKIWYLCLKSFFSNLGKSTCLQSQAICVKQAHLVETNYKENVKIKENKIIK